MDLRDRFAAQFAAALVDAFADPSDVARRAYDLAEAMMHEREQRIDAEEGAAIALEHGMISEDALPDFSFEDFDEASGDFLTLEAPASYPHPALLDDPAPMSEAEPEMAEDEELHDEELPGWLEPPYDPSWELEARWTSGPLELPPRRASSRPPGPGLARTQPQAEPAQEERPARSGRSA
jgi:hypothetical protein